jgi:hypothetical protein
MKISQRKIPEVNDLLPRVVTDERSRFSLENLGFGSSGVYECYAQKLLKENRRSDVSGSRDFGSSALRRLRVFRNLVLRT